MSEGLAGFSTMLHANDQSYLSTQSPNRQYYIFKMADQVVEEVAHNFVRCAAKHIRHLFYNNVGDVVEQFHMHDVREDLPTTVQDGDILLMPIACL